MKLKAAKSLTRGLKVMKLTAANIASKFLFL